MNLTQSCISPDFIEFSEGRRLAYHLTEGKLPGVVFLGGFNSDMTGTKAIHLEAFCQRMGVRFLRFDYSGHGQSSGNFADGTIGTWKRDALDMLDTIAPGKNILVGSSMGGWLTLLAALERPENVVGLVGIASAPDFTETLIWRPSTVMQKEQWHKEGVIHIPDCYGKKPYPITYKLIEEGRNHLLLTDKILLDIPVRLIHGMKDGDVPFQVSMQLAERLASTDIIVTLIKDAVHRLSEPEQLEIIEKTVNSLVY